MSKNVQEPRFLSEIAVVDTFIFLGVIRPALEPTQPPIKSITEGSSRGVKPNTRWSFALSFASYEVWISK